MKNEPKFTTDFNRYVREGDTIETVHDEIRYVATVYHDDLAERPDERDRGFWPSLNPSSCGYIGPKSKSTLRRHMARARAIMQAWEDDEWWYCGIAVTAYLDAPDVDDPIRLISPYAHAVWGVECNYPELGKRRPNRYLRDVANELLPDAVETATATRAALRDSLSERDSIAV